MFFDRDLWAFTRGVRGRIAWTVLVGVAAAAVGIGRLALLGWLLAEIFAGATASDLLWPATGVAVVMVLRGALDYARNMVAHETAARVQTHVRGLLYDRVVALGPAYLGVERTGAVLNSMIDGVEQLETYFGQYLPQIFVAFLTPLVVTAVLVVLDWPVALTLLAFALLTLAAPSLFHKWDSAASEGRSIAYREFAAEFLDAVQGLATLKSFGQSAARGRRLASKAHAVFRSTMWVLATNSLTRGITDAGLAIGAAAALGLGAYRVSEGLMPMGVLLVVLMVGIEAFRPQRDLRALLHQGMMGYSAAKAVLTLLRAEPVVRERAGAVAPSGLPASVTFEDVGFAYPGGRRAAHQELSFEVREGERVAFVGASGAGKSTIVRLVLRAYDPDRGIVRLGGVDLRELTLDAVHRQVAVVHQDTYLFHGTVEENLRIGRPGASQEELEAAARAANAQEFIERLPDGYRTVIGERGIRLSGGQRQRIAIARALLRDAPILILDEALSAVDAENEAVIQEALDRLMVGRTTLIFAHRLSSVIDADRILVLEAGRIVESGTHRELIGRRGAYHALMAAQASGTGAGATPTPPPAATRSGPGDAAPRDAVETEPTDAIVRAEGMGWLDAFRALLHHAVPWRRSLVAVFGLGVTRVLALIGVGVVSALVVASVKRGDPYEGLLITLAVIAPLAGLMHWLESWLAHDMAFRMLAEMRIALFAKLDRLAPAYLVRRRTGDLVSMATQDVELVEYFFAHTIAPAFVALLVPTAVLVILAASHWTLALVLAPFLAVVALSPAVARHRVDRLGSRAREALGELNAHTVDTIQGLVEVVAFQNAKRRRAEYLERVRRHIGLRLLFFRDLTLQTSLLEVATGLGGLAVIFVGARAVVQGELDPTLLPLLSLLAMAAFLPVSEIAHIGRELADTLGATRRLEAVHSEPEAVTDGPVSGRDHAGAVSIELEGVDFSYFGDHRLALSGTNFAVPAGATVALVGPSGAGKTTVAHLLMRFWDPQRGRVSIDGRDVREYDLETLRDSVALVAQDTYLFNETLRQNILLARPEATEEALALAVERAALTAFVEALPEGLDTPVGERGVRLSGGQRQRVAIARAFLKDAPVLILDEATSHLDAVNELAVRRSLDALMRSRTTVVIAHRLSTVRDADLIVVLDRGRVVESGTHEQLRARDGLYRRLVSRQAGVAAG